MCAGKILRVETNTLGRARPLKRVDEVARFRESRDMQHSEGTQTAARYAQVRPNRPPETPLLHMQNQNSPLEQTHHTAPVCEEILDGVAKNASTVKRYSTAESAGPRLDRRRPLPRPR